MKKVFYSLCAIVACTCVWVACSDDDSFEKSREQTNKERLEEIIQKYDVNFVLNDSILSTDISDAELAEFEELIKALSGIRGTYKLHADSVNDSTYLGKQMKKHQRSRRLTRANEIVNYDLHNFYATGVDDSLHNDVSYECTCVLYWKTVNGIIEWVKVEPDVSFDPLYDIYWEFYIESYSNDYSVSILSSNAFIFSGDYRGTIISSSNIGNYGDVFIHGASGFFRG